MVFTIKFIKTLSIPTVRLKEFIDVRIPLRFVISIPTGAIKRLKNFAAMKRIDLFQFLLVRLKVVRSRRHQVRLNISIPTGTIKRIRFTGQYSNVFIISIPTDAIKDGLDNRHFDRNISILGVE